MKNKDWQTKMLQHVKNVLHLLSPRTGHLLLHALPDKRKIRSPAAGWTEESGLELYLYRTGRIHALLKMYVDLNKGSNRMGDVRFIWRHIKMIRIDYILIVWKTESSQFDKSRWT